MSLARILPLALLGLALAPLAAASGFAPPAGASTIDVAGVELAHFVSASAEEGAFEVANATPPGGNATLWFALQNHRGVGNATSAPILLAFVNVSAEGFRLDRQALQASVDRRLSLVYEFTTASIQAPEEPGSYPYTFRVELYERDDNATMTLLGAADGEGRFEVASAEAPAPPGGIPTAWLVAGAAVLVVGGGLGAYGLRRRSIRRRMQGTPRSQVMREMELEKKLEKAKAPEQVAEIQQEIRQAEHVREQRRELQILEAKRADALKTLDLLRQRHEKGGLTKLQYENMAGKKKADLERIEAEIAAMQAQDGGAAA